MSISLKKCLISMLIALIICIKSVVKPIIPYTRKISQYVYFMVVVPFRIFADKIFTP